MKKLILAILIPLILAVPSYSQEVKDDRPIEAWIVYKQEGDKVIEVVKIKTASGKIYEIRPHLSKEEIPKPVNKILQKSYSLLFTLVIIILMGLSVGIGIVLWKLKKEGP